MPPSLTTPLCDRLGIRHPVILAGMAGGPTTPELVAAVSEAGGLGTFGLAGMSEPAVRAAIRAARERTRAPIAVNVLLAPSRPPADPPASVAAALAPIRRELGLPAPAPAERRPAPPSPVALLRAALEEGATIVSTGLGDPAEVVPLARDAGAPVLAMVATVADAVAAAASGADVIVAQGAEAGGHRSNFALPDDGPPPMVGTLALVPQVVAAVDVPVVATGGIMDGRGLVAALALGAQAAQFGTRFLLARESGANPGYRARLAEAADTETRIITAFSGRPARGLPNRVLTALEDAGEPSLGWPRQSPGWADIRAASDRRGSGDFTTLWAGQAARLGAGPERGAAEIVATVLAEAVAVIGGLGDLTGAG
jgi:nitronate monooxygenase